LTGYPDEDGEYIFTPHVMWIKDGESLFITVSEAETFE
jgi:hypothetical protein